MKETASGSESVNVVEPQLPVVLPVLEKRQETARMLTLFFPLHGSSALEGPDALCLRLSSFTPGRFVMAWLPGIDEKPYTISYLGGDRFGITVLKRGEFSRRLHALEVGAQVGFRGPYGRGFWDAEDSREVALIGGGCGMATLALLKESLPQSILVQGAPSAEEVLYRRRFTEQIIYTEDGSEGLRGLPTDWLRTAAENRKVRKVFTCGPEGMLKEVVAICTGAEIECQAGLERYMKCGLGLCGQCECDGRLVCLDGPVFSRQELAEMPSFGSSRRLKSGASIPISEADRCHAPPRHDTRHTP